MINLEELPERIEMPADPMAYLHEHGMAFRDEYGVVWLRDKLPGLYESMTPAPKPSARNPLDSERPWETLKSAARPINGPKRLLSVDQAAVYLSITPITLYHWVAKRYIPFVKLGSKAVRFDIRELERWVNRQVITTAKEAKHDGRLQARQVLLGDLLP